MLHLNKNPVKMTLIHKV